MLSTVINWYPNLLHIEKRSIKVAGKKNVNIENAERIQEDDAAWIQHV